MPSGITGGGASLGSRPRAGAGPQGGRRGHICKAAVLVRCEHLDDVRERHAVLGFLAATPLDPGQLHDRSAPVRRLVQRRRCPPAGGEARPHRTVRPPYMETRGRMRSTVARRIPTLASFYRYCHLESLLERNAAANVRRPKLDGSPAPSASIATSSAPCSCRPGSAPRRPAHDDARRPSARQPRPARDLQRRRVRRRLRPHQLNPTHGRYRPPVSPGSAGYACLRRSGSERSRVPFEAAGRTGLPCELRRHGRRSGCQAPSRTSASRPDKCAVAGAVTSPASVEPPSAPTARSSSRCTPSPTPWHCLTPRPFRPIGSVPVGGTVLAPGFTSDGVLFATGRSARPDGASIPTSGKRSPATRPGAA